MQRPNVWDLNDAIQGLVHDGLPVDRDALRDPERLWNSLTDR